MKLEFSCIPRIKIKLFFISLLLLMETPSLSIGRWKINQFSWKFIRFSTIANLLPFLIGELLANNYYFVQWRMKVKSQTFFSWKKSIRFFRKGRHWSNHHFLETNLIFLEKTGKTKSTITGHRLTLNKYRPWEGFKALMFNYIFGSAKKMNR